MSVYYRLSQLNSMKQSSTNIGHIGHRSNVREKKLYTVNSIHLKDDI